MTHMAKKKYDAVVSKTKKTANVHQSVLQQQYRTIAVYKKKKNGSPLFMDSHRRQPR